MQRNPSPNYEHLNTKKIIKNQAVNYNKKLVYERLILLLFDNLLSFKLN